MSLPTWTPDALKSEFRTVKAECWRLVEAQHHISTLKLVDTLDEQALLENLIEDTKPALPPECAGLDYLLSTPFRYGAVYPHGSRFRRAGRTPGVFYASQDVETAVAELAFYRLLFFAESPGTPMPANPAEYTAFSASVETDAALDLTIVPFVAHEANWVDPMRYEACQELADMARAAEAELIRYRSVRDRDGINWAVLTCRAFARKRPVRRQTWRIGIKPGRVQALCSFPPARLEFTKSDFAGDPRLQSVFRKSGYHFSGSKM